MIPIRNRILVGIENLYQSICWVLIHSFSECKDKDYYKDCTQCAYFSLAWLVISSIASLPRPWGWRLLPQQERRWWPSSCGKSLSVRQMVLRRQDPNRLGLFLLLSARWYYRLPIRMPIMRAIITQGLGVGLGHIIITQQWIKTKEARPRYALLTKPRRVRASWLHRHFK